MFRNPRGPVSPLAYVEGKLPRTSCEGLVPRSILSAVIALGGNVLLPDLNGGLAHLLHASGTGLHSYRRIERACEVYVAYRMVGATHHA